MSLNLHRVLSHAGRVLGAFVVLVAAMTMAQGAWASEHHQPSAGARGMAGADGTFEFKPSDWTGNGTTSWWLDSDGVDPGTAGCHIGTDASGKPNGRTFGEACTAEGLLVESNPGSNELHKHVNDIGHPDLFDCNQWCGGQGHASGMCVTAAAPPCATSAMCQCN